MKRVAQIFRSHAESDRADRAYYARLTPQQRLTILLDILASQREGSGEIAAGFTRVYRVTQFARR